MDFGPFGAAEIVFVALLALVLLGPRRLPQVARALGQVMTRLRRATTDLRRTLESELDQVEGEDGSVRDLARQVRSAGAELRGLSRGLLEGSRDEAGREGDGPVASARARAAGAARELRDVGRDLEDAVRRAPTSRRAPGGASPPTEGTEAVVAGNADAAAAPGSGAGTPPAPAPASQPRAGSGPAQGDEERGGER